MNESCPNCGYGFVEESMMVIRTFHSCPRCSHRFTSPITVGKPDENDLPRRGDYKPLVEGSDDD